MLIVDKINEAALLYEKSKEVNKSTILRWLQENIKRESRERELSDIDVYEMITSLITECDAAASEYIKCNRKDLCEIEFEQKCILESFLPPIPDVDKMLAVIDESIARNGVTSVTESGRIIVECHKNSDLYRADRKVLHELIRKRIREYLNK